MATLILTAVGTAVAGPLGGAIGAIAGQQIGSALFAPKARQGPRLGELAVQTSSYGSPIPKIFGTMRVAGTVIWSTDLIEDRTRSGGGKGQPKTVTYSYSASFAVALSGRPIRGVGRIWADGKLLRGAAGDFKSETGFRLYLGSEDQAVDSRIASVEGAGKAPAHRGIAYAMFEDFQLADYGNRIPSLTFEVIADAGAVAIGSIAEELSDRDIVGSETPELGGYAASGDSVRSAIEALGNVVPLSLAEQDGRLRLKAGGETVTLVSGHEAGAQGIAGSGGRSEVSRRAAANIPGEVSIAYHDIERDYQTGLQRAARGGPAIKSDRRALPAALHAPVAKAFAEHRLSRLWAARETAKVHLSWRRGEIRPGDHVQLEGEAGLWQVSRWTLDRMVVTLELVRVPAGAIPPAAAASAGRPVAQLDRSHGP
ncbi:MAG TPA: phage tail protein, partial [Allosphingosinicella sp.]|nr:phage tail protein [Allosphingosinicella sp.]